MIIEQKIESHFKNLAKQYRIVTLTGLRQSGKTTLCKKLFPDKKYFSLEDPDTRAFSLSDPRGFLNSIEDGGAIPDEIQRAPDLLSYLQTRVDASKKKGANMKMFLFLILISTVSVQATEETKKEDSLAQLKKDINVINFSEPPKVGSKGQEQNIEKQYSEFSIARASQLKELKEKLNSGKICFNNDFDCLSREFSSLGVRTAGDVSLGVAVILNYIMNAKKQQKNCDSSCNLTFRYHFIDQQLRYFALIDLKKFYSYAEISSGADGTQLRLEEDFTLFRILDKAYQSNLSILKKMEEANSKTPEIINKINDLKARLDKSLDPLIFQNSAFAKIMPSEKKDIYNYLVGEEKNDRDSNTVALRKFEDLIKRIPLIPKN